MPGYIDAYRYGSRSGFAAGQFCCARITATHWRASIWKYVLCSTGRRRACAGTCCSARWPASGMAHAAASGHNMKKLAFLALGLLASCSVKSVNPQQEADGDAAYQAARQEQQEPNVADAAPSLLLRCVRAQCTWTRTAGAPHLPSAAATIDTMPRPVPREQNAVHRKQAAASPRHDHAGRTAHSGFRSSSCRRGDRQRSHQCLAHAAHRNAPSRHGSRVSKLHHGMTVA